MFVTVALYFMLCLLPIIDSSEEVGPYFLSKDVDPWNITGPNCTLATPAFITDDKREFILEEHPELLAVLENEEDEIWVGYFRAFQNFQYIGCVNLNEITQTNTRFLTKNDPGNCYSVCHTQYVGIVAKAITNKPNCFCIISKELPISEDHCDEACANDGKLEGLLCGGEENQEKYLSLYEIEKLDAELSSRNGACCFKEPQNNLLEWGDCMLPHRTACTKGDGAMVINGSNPWKNAMQSCLHNELNPLSASENRINKTNHPEVWTAMVRREAVFNISDKSKGPTSKGYIKQDKHNTFRLKFTHMNKSFKSLCVTVTNEPSAMLSSGKQMRPREYVGVSIGVLLGPGILAAAVVILWRKRSKNTHRGKAQYANQVENAGYESDHPVSIKLQNENERPPNEIYESNYDEIENEAHRAGPISDEYDTTNAVRMNAHLDKTDNVYNRLGALEEMYNHVGPPVTVDQAASMYGYNCGEGPVRDTDGVNNEYFTLELGLGVGQPGQPKSETYGNELPEQDTNDVNHDYFTLEPGHGVGQPGKPKSETYGFELPKQDNDGVNHDYFTLEAGYGAGQPGEPEPETYGNMWPANDQNKGVFPDEDDTYNHI